MFVEAAGVSAGAGFCVEKGRIIEKGNGECKRGESGKKLAIVHTK